jgi:hypothetical protein
MISSARNGRPSHTGPAISNERAEPTRSVIPGRESTERLGARLLRELSPEQLEAVLEDSRRGREPGPEGNPWYLLATLHGKPSDSDKDLILRNRISWNRYFAPKISNELISRLLEAGRHLAEELTPFRQKRCRISKRPFTAFIWDYWYIRANER